MLREIFLLGLILLQVDGDSAAKRLSIELKPWDHFCFHDRFTFGDSIDVYFHFAPETYSRQLFYEFYVVEQYGDPDEPRRAATIIHKETERKHGLLSFTVKQPKGVIFDFCFDASAVNVKTVATLGISVTSAGEYQTLLGLANALNNASISAVDEGNRQKLRDSTLKLVRQKLRNCELMLRQMRDVEEASRSQAEENFTLVNSWSCFQVIAMVASGLMQLMTIKSLFAEDSLVKRMCKNVFQTRPSF